MCYRPIKLNVAPSLNAWRGVLCRSDGVQMVSCGRCYECKTQVIEAWSIRWREQLKVENDGNYMLTLTYKNDCLPELVTDDGEYISTLDYTDVQKFLKRLRKRQEKICKDLGIPNPKISYHGCGEYGKRGTFRPHYHLLITGVVVPPGEFRKIWGLGKVHIGKDVTARTINYILKYQLKSSLDYSDVKKNKLIRVTKLDRHGVERLDYNLKKYKQGYRVVEKSFCSKKIGSNYLTAETIALHKKNIGLNYNYFDEKKQIFVSKPLPRYYKEFIFNPKKRNEDGKLLRDDLGNYVPEWSPLDIDFENTPRFQKMLHSFKCMQEAERQILYDMRLIGVEKYLEQKRNELHDRMEANDRYLRKVNSLRRSRLKYLGVDDLI